MTTTHPPYAPRHAYVPFMVLADKDHREGGLRFVTLCEKVGHKTMRHNRELRDVCVWRGQSNTGRVVFIAELTLDTKFRPVEEV